VETQKLYLRLRDHAPRLEVGSHLFKLGSCGSAQISTALNVSIVGGDASYLNLQCDSAVNVGQRPTDIFRSPKQGVCLAARFCLPSGRAHTRQGEQRRTASDKQRNEREVRCNKTLDLILLTDLVFI
jgi:hypothetical protein